MISFRLDGVVCEHICLFTILLLFFLFSQTCQTDSTQLDEKHEWSRKVVTILIANAVINNEAW